jgi:mono/diheme cytochrome c family protein
MKKYLLVSILIASIAVTSAFIGHYNNQEQPVPIPPSVQRSGDSAKGYAYLTMGDFLKSGVPYSYFILLNGKDKHNYLNRTGRNANVDQGYNVITNADGVDIVIPTCLQCHAQVFDDKLYIGLGSTSIDFSNISKQNSFANNAAVKFMQTISPKQYEAAKAMIASFTVAYPHLETEVRGVNAADRLAILLVAHRNPQTLEWSDKALLDIPDEVIPTDVPAWWMLKKKNAMFYNGFGRGDFGQFLMLSNILATKDSSEAAEVNTHFGDVLAFIRSIQPPKYPYAINNELAREGETVFIDHCGKCHGSYGENENYPNLLIPESIIQTDSLLYKANYQNPQFIEWFNKSWFAQGEHPAKLEPSSGYVAPPLDGIWITAPYLHNGSVPTLDALLDSRKRPKYWERDFTYLQYDYENVGWKYETPQKPTAKKTYNTTLRGYSNTGHTFGDVLSDKERKAVIEYLKTL